MMEGDLTMGVMGGSQAVEDCKDEGLGRDVGE